MTLPCEAATKPNDGMGGGTSSRQNTLWLYLTILVCLGASSCKRSDPPGTSSSTPTTPTPPPAPPAPPPPPPAPAPLAVPTGLHVSQSGADFIEWAWNEVADATRYDVQVSRNESFTNSDPIWEAPRTPWRLFGLSVGETRYLRVRAVGGTANSLLVSAWTTHVTGMTVVLDDHGDTESTATTIGVPTSTRGELEEAGDVDYFRFEVRSPGTLTVYSTGQTDTFGTLFEPSGLTTEDDDHGESLNFRIAAPVGPGTHYVAVTGALAFSTTGRYELHVSFVEAPTAFLFWTDATRGWKRIDISLDGSPIGSLTAYWDEPPPADCTMPSAGRIIAERPPGTYTVEAQSDTGVIWEPIEVILQAGECHRVRFLCGEDRDCGTLGPQAVAESPD